MKELVILSNEIREENEMGFMKVVKFNFNNIEGSFPTTNICGMEMNDVHYNLGYASWDKQHNISQNTFSRNDDDLFHYTEFLEAFNAKFGLEIPTV